METSPQPDGFPPLERRFFGVAIDGDGEPVLTPVRTTVEATAGI